MKGNCSIDGCSNPIKYITNSWCNRHYMFWYRTGNPLGQKRPSKGEVENFFNESISIETDKCIVWKYSVTSAGYGLPTINGKQVLAHRAALTARLGKPTSESMFALHKPLICHNRRCFNYRHLYWGYDIDNSSDAAQDGTRIQGERVGTSKLVEQQVISIYKEVGANTSIASRYHISEATVRSIKSGRTWKWLTKELAT